MNSLLAKIWTHPLQTGSAYNEKLLISTLNTHSFNVALNDKPFFDALINSDILLPDGIGVVFALWLFQGEKIKKIAGYDLLIYELQQLDKIKGKCFFMGSTETVLHLIEQRVSRDFPNIKVGTFSPPYKDKFSNEDSSSMIKAVNDFQPNVLFVGMTAPKQEKWAYEHFKELNVSHVDCIGATFDFFAGTKRRAPNWIIRTGFEWLYRLIIEPKRMWKRYLIGNPKFIVYVLKEKLRQLGK
jgi:N-acetylglucosaminyldiphosphoundecaprenol N-acetyl-beta-D-mannosaminyltransferase